MLVRTILIGESRRCSLMNNRECFSLYSRAESSRAELVSNRESRTQCVRSCVGSLDNTWRFHADVIATFLRRDTVIRYGITFTLLIIIINVNFIRNIILALVICALKKRKRKKESWFIFVIFWHFTITRSLKRFQFLGSDVNKFLYK